MISCKHKQNGHCLLSGAHIPNSFCERMCSPTDKRKQQAMLERMGKQSLPSKLTMGKNYITDKAKREAARLRGEQIDCCQEQREKRLAQCASNECGHYAIIKGKARCANKGEEQGCGCYLGVKAGWKTSTCSLGFWNDIDALFKEPLTGD